MRYIPSFRNLPLSSQVCTPLLNNWHPRCNLVETVLQMSQVKCGGGVEGNLGEEQPRGNGAADIASQCGGIRWEGAGREMPASTVNAARSVSGYRV